jgi:hypothetical protein
MWNTAAISFVENGTELA